MRLRAVEHNHRLPEKLKLILIRLVGMRRVPDIVKTLMYRPGFWGKPMCDWTEAVMRGPSEWSVASSERTLTARSRRWH